MSRPRDSDHGREQAYNSTKFHLLSPKVRQTDCTPRPTVESDACHTLAAVARKALRSIHPLNEHAAEFSAFPSTCKRPSNYVIRSAIGVPL